MQVLLFHILALAAAANLLAWQAKPIGWLKRKLRLGDSFYCSGCIAFWLAAVYAVIAHCDLFTALAIASVTTMTAVFIERITQL